MAGEQMIEVPPTSVIRHWVAWTYGKGCPEEYVDFDPMRIKQFDRWLAEVSREERNAERKGIMDLLEEMIKLASNDDELDALCAFREALWERNDK